MPLTKSDAKKLCQRLLEDGKFVVSPHARKERDKDGLTDPDIINVLRFGRFEEPEWENSGWRYHVRAQR